MDGIGYSTQVFKEEHYRLTVTVVAWHVLHVFSGILNATALTRQDIELWLPPLPRDGVDGFAAGKGSRRFLC